MGNIKDYCLCTYGGNDLDLEKNEMNTEKNSESRKNKLNNWKENTPMRNKCKKIEFLKIAEIILENIHLISEENKNSIKEYIIFLLSELFDKKILNEKLIIIDDILNGKNIKKAKKECISLLKLIYGRKDEIRENIISSFIESLDKALKEINNEDIIKKKEVDLFIKKLKKMFNIMFEEEISNVQFKNYKFNEKSDENDSTNANNVLNEDYLSYFNSK